MLSKVLSKETCAKCRFCCSFRRCSLWETPLFPKNECEKLSKDNEYGVKSDFQMQGEYGQMKLLHKYCTQDSEEEAACDYLDEHKGCILSQEDKPFDCKGSECLGVLSASLTCSSSAYTSSTDLSLAASALSSFELMPDDETLVSVS